MRESQSGVQSAELRLYISGASEDLHEEREYLMKKVFPELRVVCRERGITFTEVDLRWGLTDEEVSDGRIIHACLEEIDRCRPYFIGIIGESYGAIPSFNEIQKYPVLLEAYPWIEEAALDGMSITEIEAQYAVLGVGTDGIDSESRDDSTFYVRRQRTSLDEVGVESAERRRLEAFQQRVRRSGAHIEEYRDASLLGEQIYDQVIAIIKRDFADATAPTPLETERMRHTAFSQSRRRAYIANPLYLTQLNEHVASDNPPLVVYAESGSGKSSLFAYWAEQYRRKHPESHVIEHYVGIGATATDHYAIIRHFCLEVKERFGRDEEIPSEPAKLDLALGQWLGYADHELTRRGERMVLILDGLNQLQGVGRSLRWIPDVIAPSIRLVLSSTVESMLVDLRKRGWGEFGMQALSEAERETIIVRYLAEYHTSLSAEQIKRIATDYKCGHPLFLKTVLEELRLVGRHEELDAKIESYLEATGTEDLFQRVLERLEEDYNMRVVRDVMTLLVASRSGLDERELSEISGLARFKIATMMAGLDYHLVRKEGRLTFFHDYLRRAVEKRYMSDEASRPAIHTKLGAYFERAEITVRNASELIYQYRRSESWQQLVLALCRMERFMVLYCGETMYEVLADWRELGEHGHDIEAGYREALARWAPEEGSSRLEGVYRVAELYDRIIHWEAAAELYRQMIEMAEAEADLAHSGAGHRGLGAIRRHQGRYDEAMEAFATARAIYEQLGNRRGLSIVIGNMGLVYWDRGEYDRALECYARQEVICREFGDRHGLSTAIGNRGNVYWGRGEYDRALECYAQQEVICRELGDRRGLSTAIGNMGNVYTNHGEYDRALECYAQQEAICRELGGRRGVSTAIGNMGYVYSVRGEHDRALECFTQMESICREIGDRMGLSRANGGMGGVYSDRGEYDQALECFARWESICREIGDRIGLSRAIGGMGGVYSDRGEYDRALECFAQTESICREIGDRSELSSTIGYMGNVYSARGEYDRALECYQQALAEHREIGFLFGVKSWLEGRAGVLLELIAQPGEMPEYLRSYLPEATEERWRTMALEQSRTDATECLTISEQLSKPNTVSSGRVLLARVEAAEGRRDVALQHLGEMLEETADDAQQAELHYRLWKLSSLPLFLKEGIGGRYSGEGVTSGAAHSGALFPKEGEVHCVEALRLYESLLARTPKHDYRKRVDELSAATNPQEATDAAAE